IVFHLAVVLVLSAATAVPEIPAEFMAVLAGLLGVFGIVYALVTTARLFKLDHQKLYSPDLSDKCFYGMFPLLAYAALTGDGIAMLIDTRVAVYALAAV